MTDHQFGSALELVLCGSVEVCRSGTIHYIPVDSITQLATLGRGKFRSGVFSGASLYWSEREVETEGSPVQYLTGFEEPGTIIVGLKLHRNTKIASGFFFSLKQAPTLWGW